MKIHPQDWPVISALFDEALDLPAQLRSRWLDELPDSQHAHRSTLEMLLANHARAETQDFLHTLPKMGVASEPAPAPAAQADHTVGPYRLLRELGRGGMGSVWLAEHVDGLLKRHVAVKLPHPGLATGAFGERLARERDILASLTHPHIARLYDAGVTADGQPFIALEYVEGRTLVDACDAQRLGVRARIELFLQVLGAVQYAHAHLVIHRDLKPSNVLVDGQGQVRLLDFGVAKLLVDGLGEATELTLDAGQALTPDYASPEQIMGRALSTASDVYSLGVLLFELLTGERPYRLKRDARAALEEAILAAVPRRPSQTLRDPALAERRTTTLPKLARALRGDLDAIILQALKKVPEERYATADAFARDLERHLRGEPVQAQPEALWYRTGKFIVRNKIAIGAAMGFAVALSMAAGVALWQARMARAEAETAKAVQAFTEDILLASSDDNPDPVKARQTTARELLDRAAAKVDSSLIDAPVARLRMLTVLTDMYANFRLVDRAGELGRKTVALTRSLYGPDDPRVAFALAELAEAMPHSSDAEYGKLLDEATAILDRNGDFDSATRALVLRRQSNRYRGRDEVKSLDFARQAVEKYRELPDKRGLTEALMALGTAQDDNALHRQAEASLVEALAVSQQVPDTTRKLQSRLHAYLASVEFELQNYSAAEDHHREAFASALSFAGENHVDTIQTEYRLGQFLFDTARTKEGLSLLLSAEARAARVLGQTDPSSVPTTIGMRGAAQARFGQLEEGEAALAHEAELKFKRKPSTLSHALTLIRLAKAHIAMGRTRQADEELSSACDLLQKVHAAARWRNSCLDGQVWLLLTTGRSTSTAALLDAFEVEAPSPERSSQSFLLANTVRAEVALANADYRAAIEQADRVTGLIAQSPARPYLAESELRAALVGGKALRLAGQSASAVAELRYAVELAGRLYDPLRSPVLADAQLALAQGLLDLGQASEARKLYAAAAAIDATHPELSPLYLQPLRQLHTRLDAKGSVAIRAIGREAAPSVGAQNAKE